MTPEQKALAKQYIENQADVSTSTSLLRAAMEEIEECERQLKWLRDAVIEAGRGDDLP